MKIKGVCTTLLTYVSLVAVAQAQKISVGAGQTIDPYHYTSFKYGHFKNGVVSCAHPLAAEVGAAILKAGGNAFDAVIATQWALAVVYPEAGNIAGGGFLTGRTSNGKLTTIDFREKAPAKASRDMYLDKNGDPIPRLSLDGQLAVGVPGSVAGLFETAKYGKLPMKTLIQPAIELAEKGFVLTEREAAQLNAAKLSFIRLNGTRKIPFLKSDTSDWKIGDTLIQPDLAKSLERIRDNGAKGFYQGKTAQLIVAEMRRGNGLITNSDLENYKAVERKPLHFTYRGYDIIGFPPPSSGGIILGQMLKMVEPFPLGYMGFHSPQSIHLMTEVERRSYADRAQYLGDPDFWNVPDSMLLSAAYLQNKMSDYDDEKATPSSEIAPGLAKQEEETTHISVSDKWGNMVSVTTTLNNLYGCKTVVAGAGFLLNDEMDDFSMKPGVPNLFGAVGGEANAIAPNKRMLSSMCPTLVLKNGNPYIVVGTPGGTTIPTSVFQNLVNVLDFNMPINEAINASKFHHQWLPDTLYMEKTFDQSVFPRLKAMGYSIALRGSIGKSEIVRYVSDEKSNFDKNYIEAAADIRGDDSVAGY